MSIRTERIFHMYGKRTGCRKTGCHICISFEKGDAELQIINPEIIQVVFPCGETRRNSQAVEGNGTAAGQAASGTDACQNPAAEFCAEADIIIEETDTALAIHTAALTVKVYDGGYMDFYKKDGTLLCMDYRGERKPVSFLSRNARALLEAEGHAASSPEYIYPVQSVKVLDGDEKFYGLGDKTGFLNKLGYEYENWNTDNPQAQTDAFKALYKSVPFLITLKEHGVYGLFFDNTFRSCFNLGKENSGYYFYGADGGYLNYYFIGGATMADVIKNYTYLTGRTPLPQLWTLGYHQSRWGYECAEDIREVAGKFRELSIPCDTIHFDIDYMDGFRVFTWNEKDYGAPGELISELGGQGYKAVTIIDPGVKLDEGYSMYDEGIANDYFAKTPQGDVYDNWVWPGAAVFPDFGKSAVRSWWAGKQSFLTGMGVAGVWNDMNEPASFHGELPPDVVFSDEDKPLPHAAMHNIYGHQMAKATYEGLRHATGKRPFVITRACYAGTQKYSTVWTGDNQSLWAHLQMAVPQLINLGLSGFAFAGTDVGGFGADCTPELLSRWVQVGAFSPLFRNHSCEGCVRQEPWMFDRRTLDINRKFIELRYRLLPYFYDLFYECENTGLPVMRPLVLHYAQDPETWNLNGEFLVGEHLLVAPVLEQGATRKMVYLPEGTWYDFNDGSAYVGGQYHLVEAPLDVCPMFAKEGSMIPTWDVQQYVGEHDRGTLKLLVFPGHEGRYVHYRDNGEDFAYRDGAYTLYEFCRNAAGGVDMNLLHEGYPQYKEIVYVKIGN